MTPEKLLRPRYKVIADYPQPPFNEEGDKHKFIEGDILTYLKVNNTMTFIRTGRCGSMSVGVPCIAHPEKYPKIFQKLQWWEERTEEELLGLYVKKKYSPYICTKVNAPIGFGGKYFVWDNLKNSVPFNNYIPITKEEYETYLQTQTSNINSFSATTTDIGSYADDIRSGEQQSEQTPEHRPLKWYDIVMCLPVLIGLVVIVVGALAGTGWVLWQLVKMFWVGY